MLEVGTRDTEMKDLITGINKILTKQRKTRFVDM